MSQRLRSYVRLVLEDLVGASVGNAAHEPYSGLGITMADREQMGNTMPDEEEDPQELTPHLRCADEPDEDELGPVPPRNNGDIYAMSDPYSKSWHVIPTPRIFGR
jgi:hypothetical protein